MLSGGITHRGLPREDWAQTWHITGGLLNTWASLTEEYTSCREKLGKGTGYSKVKSTHAKQRHCWSAGPHSFSGNGSTGSAGIIWTIRRTQPACASTLRNWLVGGYHGQEKGTGICCVLLPIYSGRAHINSDSASCFLLHVSLSALPKKGRLFSKDFKPHERMGWKQGPHLFSRVHSARGLERDAFEVIWNKYGCLKFTVFITQEARPFALLLIRFLGTAWDLMTCS